MNILILTPAYPNKGNIIEGIFNEQHTLALKKIGANVTIVLCKPWLPGWMACFIQKYRHLKNFPGKEKRDGIEIIYARYIHIPKYRFLNLTVHSCIKAILKALKNHLRNKKFDVMQVHSAWPIGLAAPRLARVLNLPFVVTSHIEDDPEMYSSSHGSKLYKSMLEQAAAVVVVGSPLEKFLRNVMPTLNADTLVKIPNGIDMQLIDKLIKEWQECSNGEAEIVSVCNLWHIKGIDLNLRALAKLSKKGILSWKYSIVGDGPERKKLEQLSEKLKISRQVKFLGRLPHKDALKKISESDIFSMPSRNESFGLVYLESMACAKPVIGCLHTGAEDLIIHEKTGLLVPQEDVERLASALERFILNPDWAGQLGRSGRQRAEQFKWENVASKYTAIYQRVSF